MAHLLLLDGSPEVLEGLRTRLQDLGHEVVACATGRQALSHVEDARFDVVILDLDVGDVSPFDVTAKIAANALNWASPIIATTSAPQPESLFKVMNAGASFLLAKPFAFGTLAHKVELLLTPRDVRKGAYDPAIVRGFLEATVHVVGRLGNVPVAAGRPFLKPDALAFCEVNSLLDLRGGGIAGTLCFSFHPDTLETLLGSLFYYEHTERVSETLVRDAVLEVTNLVVGHAKRLFRRDCGLLLDDSPARCIHGVGIQIPYAAKAPILVVPFSVPGSWPFYLEFCLVLGENEPLIPGSSPARLVFEPGEIHWL